MSDPHKTYKWRQKAQRILRRDHYQCQICKQYGITREATEVHHVKPWERYPELAYTDSNLISLCHACHNKQHPEKGIRGAHSRY